MPLAAELFLAVFAVAAALMVGYLVGSRRRGDDRAPDGDVRLSPVTEPTKVHRPVEGNAEIETVLAATNAENLRSDRMDHIERALDDLRLGVVVFGGDGIEVYRNLVGRRFVTARHGEALVEAALERVVAASSTDRSPSEEVRLYGPPPRTLKVQASPIGTGGEKSGVVATISDVTEARHLDRVRSDFVANVSHELRTPVGAMSVLAETLAASDDPEVRARLAERIQVEADRLADTIEDLLTLSRLESGQEQLDDTFDLISVVATAIDRTAESTAQRAVEVALSSDLEDPVLIDGHFSQLVSAVVNLIENGTKYSPAGSTVTVTIGVQPGPDGESAVLSVIDEGIGIPEADLTRVFERFYRVDTARSRTTGGTGLGLSIVRNAVRNHGGSVEVDSTEGRGSRFTVRIPISDSRPLIDRLAAHDREPPALSDQERD